MPSEALTDRQQEVLDFIKGWIRTMQRPPTYLEIGHSLGMSSPNAVACHLKAIEKKGYINRERDLSRGITVVDRGPKGIPLWKLELVK